MATISKFTGIITRCTMLFRTAHEEQIGVPGRFYSCLINICRNPGISQDALGRQVFINKSNVTRQLDKLTELGLVRREPCAEDRRVTRVYPTAAGEAALPRIFALNTQWADYLSEGIDAQEFTAFMATLEKVAARAAQYAQTEDLDR